MPSACVCCGNPASQYVRASSTRVEGKRVIRTKTSAWEFPQCAACARHDSEWPDVSGGLLVALVVLTLGIYLYFYLQRRQRALSMCTVACARPRMAVQYFGWHGTIHYFDFHSPRFVREFLVANKSKVVEADSRALALLDAPAPPTRPTTPAPVAPPPRAPALRAPVPSAPSIAESPRAAKPARGQGLQFLGLNDRVTVAGRALLGPLTYVSSGFEEGASVIVTTAPVGRSERAEPLPYWPSYAAASPDQRALYLDWLATGRVDPAVPIGYVFIYFYGLEQRILIDERDHADVRSEVRRLLAIYGENRSFRGYAQSLLAFSVLSQLAQLREEDLRDALAPMAATNSTALAGVLAWFHLRDRPLPAEYAAIVVRSMEGAKRGVVVERAARELGDLFAIRYREKFGSGMTLQAAKRYETIAYHPASATLAMSRRDLRVSVPHVLGRSAQFTPLVTLWNNCIAALKKVSSAKRNVASTAGLTAEAWAALPPELRADYDHPAQDAWDELVARAPKLESYHVVTAAQLVALGGTQAPASVSAVQLRQACETAALLGYAVEPDARVETKKRPGKSELLIWRVDDTRSLNESVWRSAHTMLSLMLSVASADGAVAAEEARVVGSIIEELFVLDDLMRSRVEALRHLLTRSPAKVGTIARTLQTTRTPDELRKIGRVLVAVAGADGVITEAEHKSLRALYKGLGLSSGDLDAAVIASGAQRESDEPVSVRPAEAAAPGQPIPPRAKEKAPALDGKAIAAILAETREVAALLSTVLDADDEAEDAGTVAAPPVAAAPPPATATADGILATLDVRYQPIVQQLLSKPVWTTAEIRALAAGAKLMPGAIVETVNSWSDDRLGDYLIEEADGWHIKAELVTRANA